MDIAKFENDKGDIRLASCTEKVTINEGGEKEIVYKAAVYLNKAAIRSFLEKIHKYLHENTPKGNPKYERLVANIEEIRAATLESFWQEPEIPFPGNDQNVWWEVWINRKNGATTPEREFLVRLHEAEVQVGSRILIFPEHLVILVKGTFDQLGKSLLYTDQLAEIRKPAETANVPKLWRL